MVLKGKVDLKQIINVVLYVSGLLHPKYPSFRMPLVILCESVKRFKRNRSRSPYKKSYRLCRMPNRLNDTLQKDNIVHSEHTIFVNKTIYQEYVPQTEIPWVNLAIVMKKSSKSLEKLNGVVGKILKRQNSSMLVPVVQVENCQAGVIFIKEDFYSNLQTKYKVSSDHTFSGSLQEFQKSHTIPQIATKATIALLNLPHELPSELLDLILKNFFEKPRFIYRNHTYGIGLTEELLRSFLFSRYHHIFSRLKCLHFRCISLESKNNNFENHAIILKNCTSLQQMSSVKLPLPHAKLHDLAFANSCPDGLRQYFDRLKACLMPFLCEKKSSLLASRNIHPILIVNGERGCGKSTIIRSLASFLGLRLFTVDCSEIVTAVAAQTEAKMRLVLSKYSSCHPLIICLQNFEVFGVDNEGNDDQRMIEMFQSEVNELFSKSTTNRQPVFLIATSNCREVKSSIRRHFLDAVAFEAPTSEERYDILRWLHTVHSTVDGVNNSGDYANAVQVFNTRWSRLHAQTDACFTVVAGKTVGFLFGDLKMLYSNALNSLTASEHLTEEHFTKHLAEMQEQFSDSMGAPRVLRVLWDDIGGLAKIKDEIQNSIGLPLKHVHLMGSNLRRSGILLYGPPGTGKTLVAKAVATECNLNFLAVQGPELLNMYVGQSEQNVREVFTRARASAPCVVFLDELDSLAPNRGVAGDSGGVMDRVVSQLLAEMDGMGGDQKKQIFILAATNRPDLIDPALLRPGRFDKLFYVGPCTTTDEKLAVLQAQTKKFILEKSVKLKKIAEMLRMEMTGADIYSICSNAWLNAVRRTVATDKEGKSQLNELSGKSVVVNSEDFKAALGKFVPSISKSDLDYFSNLKENFGS
ncbi:peroxisome assembly factor 2 [Sergentomyia squamirostris]